MRCSNKLIFVAVPNPVQVGYQFRKYVAEPEFVKEIDEKWTDIGMIRRQLEAQGVEILAQGVLDVPPWPDTVMPASELLGRLGIRSKKLQGRFQGEGWQWSTMDFYLGRQPDLYDRVAKYMWLERLADPVADQAGVGAPPLGVGPEGAEMTSGGTGEPENGRAGERGSGGAALPGSASHPVTQSPILRFLDIPWLQIALIVAVAAFFRLWQIGSIPPGLFGDEATDGLDALDVLAGRGAIFFPANFGREGLHMWLVAGMFRLMGVTPLALRLPSALAGIATALATYWLGRELVAATDDGRQTTDARFVPRLLSFVPLIAALYIATSYWHVHFSRFGIRGVFTPLLGALAFAAFWRAVNRANQRISKSANQQISRSQMANCRLQRPIRNSQSAIRNTFGSRSAACFSAWRRTSTPPAGSIRFSSADS